ncbi:hypothetical protein K505DRAFT_56904 [Melanomma pulvis-pyrius CBS 109.77]|uniref:Uncharacterized protein n=1 Tax=Melanomma pulvis-pyrius CBS 109.77 TaxID=1314802 RepID=A0A6A6X7U0_9PLEO|nr:hypothetical protein K505DRAFT_56904 [Melanomma pulvis-pyrius CBS 109.77]
MEIPRGCRLCAPRFIFAGARALLVLPHTSISPHLASPSSFSLDYATRDPANGSVFVFSPRNLRVTGTLCGTRLGARNRWSTYCRVPAPVDRQSRTAGANLLPVACLWFSGSVWMVERGEGSVVGRARRRAVPTSDVPRFSGYWPNFFFKEKFLS